MPTLTPQQTAILERLLARGFVPSSFPLYPNCIGMTRGNCAALLVPEGENRLRLFGEASYIVDGQLSVRVVRGGQDLYVWKRKELAVTPQREAEIEAFRRDLLALLA